MNPIKKLRNVCTTEDCYGKYICVFFHLTGERFGSQEEDRAAEQKLGIVRCPHEWEISAVR